MKCDVVVVGGGPAGLAASIIASGGGLNTVLIEKSSEIGYPIRTSALTWKEVLDSWDLPDSVMHQWYSSFYIKSKNTGNEAKVNFEGKRIGALDYHKFLRELAFKGVKNGTKLLLSENVKEPIMEGGFVRGVKTNLRDIESNIVLDCSGSNSVIAKKLGLAPDWKKVEIGIGKEYEMTNFEVNDVNCLEFYVGDKLTPIGYGWVFPLEKDKARVGVCTVYNTPEKIVEKNINYWQDKFLSEESPIHKNVKSAEPYEIHMGSYPLCGMLEQPYSDGLILAGDSAAQASMLLGEGIRYAMEFGRRAAETAIEASKKNDFSSEVLKNYVDKCINYIGETFEVSANLLQVPTNEYWDNLIDAVSRLDEEDRGDLFLTYLKTAMSYEDAEKIFPAFKEKYL